MSTLDLTDTDVLSLGPSHLLNRNLHRYQGQQERVTLDVFAEEDRSLLHLAYDTLLELYEPLKPVLADSAACRTILETFLGSDDYHGLAQAMSHLGQATAIRQNPEDAQRLVHDLRGGAYQAFSFQLQLLQAAPERAYSPQTIYFLLRDHLKIMRNCVADLDPGRFAADATTKDHDVNLLVEKWSQPEFNAVRHPVRVELRCQFSGTLCESCLEFSSLDRIIYNLMNNAARFTSDDRVVFCISGVPEKKPEVVRFVVANAVKPEHREALKAQFGDSPGEFFRGGFTTGGHGVGARICADFCAHAFGISDFDRALNGGYFGAKWIGNVLAVWFHWPIVAD